MILIKNTQRAYKVDTQKITKIIQRLLDELGYSDFDIGIWLTTNKTTARLNKKYRGKSGPTDILSFPYHTTLKAGQKIIITNPDDRNLGDLVISLEYLYAAEQWSNILPSQRLPIVLVHGLCHLAGYDHETDQDYNLMHKKELSLRALLK